MDPFSIVVGAVALTEAANKLAGALTDRYKAFSSAPKQMIEIASQITLCAGLVDVFARSVDGAGQGFPKRFKDDATSLVRQCRAILKDIDLMIPHGSGKPDYQQRLKYAFRDEKKVRKHQDRLKEVQHMFMFMTTCWMYQLPSPRMPPQPKQPTMGPAPIGALGVPAAAGSQISVQQVPMQLNLRGFGANSDGVTYEATLTLTPTPQPEVAAGRPLETEEVKKKEGSHEKTAGKTGKPKMSEYQKESLENMRRSPYFSLKLLRLPAAEENPRYIRNSGEHQDAEKAKTELAAKKSDEEQKAKLRAEMETRKSAERKAKGEERRDFEPSSREEAEKDIGDILAGWFHDGESYPDRPSRPGNLTPSAIPSSRPTSKSTSPVIPLATVHNHVVAPAADLPKGSAASLGPFPPPIVRIVDDWDWRCDGCNRKFFYHDLRYKCQDCLNFDLCPSCYSHVWHRHPRSNFAERSV
ncbi:hypothetical protein LZ554_008462 [Drepanopeziza brunnea f. sp. 'monogermtubi']|nr:hypothetical protein LZ554_008462 [Drepanopeziza brunnea f. sp. 'monogermtubi']